MILILYLIPRSFPQKIYLPGDNDIGGEEDSVSFNIHNRFNFAYTQPDTLVYKSVTFFKVMLLHRDPCVKYFE